MILETTMMKELFLTVLKRAKRRYDFRIENFCIMGNHIHLLIQPGRTESLSAIMQWILSVFAMAFNKRMGYSGHVWGSRFYSRIISSIFELIQAFEYIDANPEKASQVKNRRQWHWGGLWHDRIGNREIVGETAAWLRLFSPEHELLLLNGPK